METKARRSGKTAGRRGFKTLIAGLAFSLIFIQNAVAQADISNVHSNLKSIKERQEEIAQEEFMSYVYMTIGFALVIAIAWFTTVAAKKRAKQQQEERQKMVLKAQKHGHHHPHHGTHHLATKTRK